MNNSEVVPPRSLRFTLPRPINVSTVCVYDNRHMNFYLGQTLRITPNDHADYVTRVRVPIPVRCVVYIKIRHRYPGTSAEDFGDFVGPFVGPDSQFIDFRVCRAREEYYEMNRGTLLLKAIKYHMEE